MCAQISFTLSKTYSLELKHDSHHYSFSCCKREKLQSLCGQTSTKLCFIAIQCLSNKRKSTSLTHKTYSRMPQHSCGSISRERAENIFDNRTGAFPFTLQNAIPYCKKQSHFAAGGQLCRIGNHAIFQFCCCIIQRDLKTSFHYKSMQSVQLQDMQLLALLSVFPTGKYFSLSYTALCQPFFYLFFQFSRLNSQCSIHKKEFYQLCLQCLLMDCT